MKKLLHFLYDYKNLITFLILESIGLTLIFDKNIREKASTFNSSHPWAGSAYEMMADLRMHGQWKEAYNDALAENARLRSLLQHRTSVTNQEKAEYLISPLESLIPARVINNSIIYTKNYITINKGSRDGVIPGMGVMSSRGVVGRVKGVSENFATIISLLHEDMQLSAKLVSSGVVGTIRWGFCNLTQVNLFYVPRHITIEVGDEVVTSGYNATFGEGISVGRVSQVKLDAAAMFYDILVDLSTDFSALQQVYLIRRNGGKEQEKEALEGSTKSYYE